MEQIAESLEQGSRIESKKQVREVEDIWKLGIFWVEKSFMHVVR